MKNFNRCSSHGDHSSKHRELSQHPHSCGSHAFTHTHTSTQLQPRTSTQLHLQPCCVKHQLSYYIIWNQTFILKVPESTFGEERHWWSCKPNLRCITIKNILYLMHTAWCSSHEMWQGFGSWKNLQSWERVRAPYMYWCRSFSFFLHSSIGGLAYVTIFNSSATWAATFCLWGYKCMLVIFMFPWSTELWHGLQDL